MKIKHALAELKQMQKDYGEDCDIFYFAVAPDLVMDAGETFNKHISVYWAQRILKDISVEEETVGHVFQAFDRMVDERVSLFNPDPLEELHDKAKAKRKKK